MSLAELTENKLSALHNQVLQSQRMLDLIKNKNMEPGDWGWFRRWQNEVAAHRYDWSNTPLDAIWQASVKFVAPDGLNPTLSDLMEAYQLLIAGKHNNALSASDQGELDRLSLDGLLPDNLKLLNRDRMSEFNLYINQAITNGLRIDPMWLNDAASIAANGRIMGR